MTTAAPISEVGICNQALARIGSTQQITSLTDGSNEAQQCLLNYPSSRDEMLAAFPWPWAKGYQALDQVAGPEIAGQVANAEWARSYRYPSDCVTLRRLVPTVAPATVTTPATTGTLRYPTGNQPWLRAVGQPCPISYDLGSDGTGRLIFTDSVGDGYGLTAVYTRMVADPTQFSPDFAEALTWNLAIDLAMALGFSEAKQAAAMKGYEAYIRKARAARMNELQTDLPLVRYQSEMTRARWGG